MIVHRYVNATLFSKMSVWVLVLFALLPLYVVASSFSPPDSTDNRVASLDKIAADTQQKTLTLTCSFPQKEVWDSILAGKIKLHVAIRKKGRVYEDIYIKTKEPVAENTLVLTLQPPMKDALYGIEKQDFILYLKGNGWERKISKTAILGTATQRLDLRIYSVASPIRHIINSLLILIGLSALYGFAIFFNKKYHFKKDHIKKYKQITLEGKASVDPFTFESLEENNEVVFIEDKIMLLSSWKRLHALRPEKQVDSLELFFKETEKNNLFKPTTPWARKINRVWFGTIAGYIGWLLYTFLMKVDGGNYRFALFSMLNTRSAQFSDVVYINSLLAIAIALPTFISFSIADHLYGSRRHSLIKLLYKLFLTIVIVAGSFILQSFLTIHLFNHQLTGSLIAWLCIGAGWGIAAGMRLSGKKIITVLIIGIAGFIGYQAAYLKPVTDVVGIENQILTGLLIAGGLVGWFTCTPSITSKEDPQVNVSPIQEEPVEPPSANQ